MLTVVETRNSIPSSPKYPLNYPISRYLRSLSSVGGATNYIRKQNSRISQFSASSFLASQLSGRNSTSGLKKHVLYMETPSSRWTNRNRKCAAASCEEGERWLLRRLMAVDGVVVVAGEDTLGVVFMIEAGLGVVVDVDSRGARKDRGDIDCCRKLHLDQSYLMLLGHSLLCAVCMRCSAVPQL